MIYWHLPNFAFFDNELISIRYPPPVSRTEASLDVKLVSSKLVSKLESFGQFALKISLKRKEKRRLTPSCFRVIVMKAEKIGHGLLTSISSHVINLLINIL